MSNLNDKLINQAYKGLIHTSDEAAINGTPKRLQDGEGNNLPVEVGTTSMKYYGTQDFTNATVTGISGGGGGGATYDLTSEQDGDAINIKLTGSDASVDTVQIIPGANITLTDFGGNQFAIEAAGGGGGSSVVGTNPGKEYFYSDNSLWKAYKFPANTYGSITNLTQYAFGTVARAYAIPTTKWKEGDVIDELLFNIQTAYAAWDGFMVALYDSEYNVDGELIIGDRLTVFTENATLLQTTGTKQVTGINYTVPATTSGSGVYFVLYWMNNSSGNSQHIVVKGYGMKNDFISVWASNNFFFDTYSLQTTWSGDTVPPATGLVLEASNQGTQMLNLFR